jgi:hypothetical protein
MKEIAWKVGDEDYGAFRKVFQKIMDFRRATIDFDSAFKEIELVANSEFNERETLYCSKKEDSRGQE